MGHKKQPPPRRYLGSGGDLDKSCGGTYLVRFSAKCKCPPACRAGALDRDRLSKLLGMMADIAFAKSMQKAVTNA
jgi:hypothetical protein